MAVNSIGLARPHDMASYDGNLSLRVVAIRRDTGRDPFSMEHLDIWTRGNSILDSFFVGSLDRLAPTKTLFLSGTIVTRLPVVPAAFSTTLFCSTEARQHSHWTVEETSETSPISTAEYCVAMFHPYPPHLARFPIRMSHNDP